MGQTQQTKRHGAAKPAQKRTPASRLTILLLAILLVALGTQIYRMTGKIRAAKAEEVRYAQQLQELQAANQKLRDDLDNSMDPELIEDIARNKLGMVGAGEKVFHYSK